MTCLYSGDLWLNVSLVSVLHHLNVPFSSPLHLTDKTVHSYSLLITKSSVLQLLYTLPSRQLDFLTFAMDKTTKSKAAKSSNTGLEIPNADAHFFLACLQCMGDSKQVI